MYIPISFNKNKQAMIYQLFFYNHKFLKTKQRFFLKIGGIKNHKNKIRSNKSFTTKLNNG